METRLDEKLTLYSTSGSLFLSILKSEFSRESIEPDPEKFGYARALLKAVNSEGVVLKVFV